MKIGFSSLVCPSWNFETIVTRAAELGFQGIELRGLQGELHLPAAAALSRPEQIRQLLGERGIELVCLGSSVALTAKSRKDLAEQKAALQEYIELAHRLGCPNVRLFAGEAEDRDTARAALVRASEALASAAASAGRFGVTLLVENGGDFPSSNDSWFLVDAVNHPNLRCCWNQCNAMSIRERPTFSLPRLGTKIGMAHFCDAAFDEQGVLLEYRKLGEGDAEVAKQIEILRGLVYQGYLVFEWPKLWIESLPPADVVLPEAAAYLKQRLAAQQSVLSAYKGDKNAPKYRAPRENLGAAPV
jgi:sugar phosphate isomerase/epimerase